MEADPRNDWKKHDTFQKQENRPGAQRWRKWAKWDDSGESKKAIKDFVKIFILISKEKTLSREKFKKAP